ncbi:MAG: hypothetical protein HGA75_09365 [Thiobacillus sp.]|nr:hypothetical protein [Thiobacillus sp.]
MTKYRRFIPLFMPTRWGAAATYDFLVRAHRRQREQLREKTALANWEGEGGRVMAGDTAPR